MRLRILHLSPRAVSFMVWFVRQFHNSLFSAGLAGRGQVGVLAPQSDDDSRVVELSVSVIGFLRSRVLSMKRSPLFLSCLARTFLRAVTTIAVWRGDWKVLSANTAVSSSTGDIGLFMPSQSAGARLASKRAVSFIGAFGFKLGAAR